MPFGPSLGKWNFNVGFKQELGFVSRNGMQFELRLVCCMRLHILFFTALRVSDSLFSETKYVITIVSKRSGS